MKKQLFIPEQEVRFAVASYYELGKSEFNRAEYLEHLSDKNKTPVLGGRYIISQIFKNDWGVNIYEIASGGKKFQNIYQNQLRPYSLEEECDFNVGQRVALRNSVSLANRDFFNKLVNKPRNENSEDGYCISKIINGFYLILALGSQEIMFPFMWLDFYLV